uniref:Uncharacterized protein n=1 Tax=Stomoxys calcitrans TaxID=35570 RepID=A0A1I8PYI8_STOCA
MNRMKTLEQGFIIVIGIVLLTASNAAQRPDWFPENRAEIEANCLMENSIDDETLTNIRQLKLDDTPQIRSLIMCSLINTNAYRPDREPEADRLVVAFQQNLKRDCDIDMVESCIDQYKHLQPDDYKYFTIIKCIFNEAPTKCTLIK